MWLVGIMVGPCPLYLTTYVPSTKTTFSFSITSHGGRSCHQALHSWSKVAAQACGRARETLATPAFSHSSLLLALNYSKLHNHNSGRCALLAPRPHVYVCANLNQKYRCWQAFFGLPVQIDLVMPCGPLNFFLAFLTASHSGRPGRHAVLMVVVAARLGWRATTETQATPAFLRYHRLLVAPNHLHSSVFSSQAGAGADLLTKIYICCRCWQTARVLVCQLLPAASRAYLCMHALCGPLHLSVRLGLVISHARSTLHTTNPQPPTTTTT